MPMINPTIKQLKQFSNLIKQVFIEHLIVPGPVLGTWSASWGMKRRWTHKMCPLLVHVLLEHRDDKEPISASCYFSLSTNLWTWPSLTALQPRETMLWASVFPPNLVVLDHKRTLLVSHKKCNYLLALFSSSDRYKVLRWWRSNSNHKSCRRKYQRAYLALKPSYFSQFFFPISNCHM